MRKTYVPYDPDQQLLLPAALQEWLPDDHLAYFISDVVDQLDLSEITARYEWENRGGPPYHPRMMVKVLLDGYCVGVASSRRIAGRLHEDIAFRVPAANNAPDFRTISDFRKDHLAALWDLFLQVLALCQRARLVKLGHVALDGTKVRANASKHKAMSYKRMKEKEAELLRQAHEADDEEDNRYGKAKRGDELPGELSFREGPLEKIREAMAALKAEARAGAGAEQAKAEGKDHPGVPEDKAQRNFTDAKSRIMPAPGGRDFQQAYNCQAVVDSAHQVIVAARATNQASDKQQAVAMLEETISNTGVVPREVSADAGDSAAKAVDGLQGLGVDLYVAPEQTRRGRVPPPAPGDAYPVVCPPGTGCGASCRPSEAASVTPCAWRPSSRSSARSSRAVASGSSCCEAWRRSGRNGLSSAPDTTCSNCSAWVVKPTVLAGQRVLFPIGLAPANPGSANSVSYRHAGSHYRKFLILRRAASTTTTGLGWWLRPDFATGGAASLMGAARPLVAPLRTLQP